MSDVEYQDYDGTWKAYNEPWPMCYDEYLEYKKLGTFHLVPMRTSLSEAEVRTRYYENVTRLGAAYADHL
jgi:hypothetical protein